MAETFLKSLAQRVLKSDLTLPEALERVAARNVLARFDDNRINRMDDHIRALAEQDLAQATILAVLNHEVARHKAGDLVWGHCNSTLGWLYLQRDEREQALHHYQEALDIFELILKPEAQKTVARIWHDIGEIRERQGDFEAAIKKYAEALTLAQGLKLSDLECYARNGLGRVYLAQERIDAALQAFEDALELSKKGGDKHGEAMSLGNLGSANHFLGRLQEAEDFYEEAIELVDPSLIAVLFNQEAEDYYEKAIELSQKTSQAVTGRLLNNYGNVLIDRGKLDKAEKCLLEALDIARQRQDRWGEQQRVGNLGNLYQARAKRETDPQQSKAWLLKAEQHHQEAVAIARERNDRHGQAIHLLNLGNVYSKLGRFEEADECYAEALDLADALVWGGVDIRWRVHSAWGDLCAAQGQDKPAFDHYASAIKIVEDQRDELSIPSRMKFWQERSILYKQMVLCCFRLGKLWPALVYTERAKARYLADLLAQHIPLEGDTQIEASQQRALQQSEQPSREEETEKLIEATIEALPPHTAVVVFNVTKAGTVVFIVTDRLGGSEEDTSDKGWEKSSDGRIRAKLIADFGQDDLQRMLVEVDDFGEAIGGCLVDYYSYIDYRNKIDGRNNDGDRLEERRRLRELWKKWTSQLEAVSTKIYEALLASVHRKLTELAIKRLVLMPNLGLSLLPLHASYKSNGRERDYLLDHYEITYVPSFDLLHHCQMRASSVRSDNGHLLAVVDPTGSLDWAPVEVEYIARLFSKSRVLDGHQENQATRQAVMDEMPDYAFVHFACHGEFNLREPMQSALKLAPTSTDDGLLTLEDVLNLKLPHTPLVVMSACETSMVDPGDLADEYLGLQGGFLKAGALNVVGSLWAVGDLPTALLMGRFYDNLCRLNEPMAPVVALHEAQCWLQDRTKAEIETLLQNLCQDLESARRVSDHVVRSVRSWMRRLKRMDDPPFSHPYWWAAFQVVGAGLYPIAAQASLTISGGSGVDLETYLGTRDGRGKSNNKTALVHSVHGQNRNLNRVSAADGINNSLAPPSKKVLEVK